MKMIGYGVEIMDHTQLMIVINILKQEVDYLNINKSFIINQKDDVDLEQFHVIGMDVIKCLQHQEP